MSRSLLLPERAREKIARRYCDQHRQWLFGAGEWPWAIKLGSPVEADASKHVESILSWVSAWQSWSGAGTLVWCEKRWYTVGKQRLPEKLIINNVNEAAAWLGETTRWEKVETRYHYFISKWPALAATLTRYFDILADYAQTDIERLERMLEWISQHPQSNLYPRQLPVPGLDSKWLERRKGLIADLVTSLKDEASSTLDFYRRCGLKPLPVLMRLRILDSELRAHVGGLEDITAPVNHIATLNLPVSHVYIVENLQTGLAFNDLPGSIVIVGLGYHVDVLAELPWLKQAKCYYWGDIDTHGFAILNRARSYLPDSQSVLMDEKTLHQHQPLWGKEDKQHAAIELPHLTKTEQSLYLQIKQQHWGENLRLEQEKICWEWAWERIILKSQNE
jgi:hypothetical protein